MLAILHNLGEYPLKSPPVFVCYGLLLPIIERSKDNQNFPQILKWQNELQHLLHLLCRRIYTDNLLLTRAFKL